MGETDCTNSSSRELEGERKGQPWVIFFNLFLLAEGSGCRGERGLKVAERKGD